MNFQGSLQQWCIGHRVHHLKTETDSDPHNQKRGFFFAHLGWVFQKEHPSIVLGVQKLNIQDLLDDAVFTFDSHFYLFGMLFFSWIVPCTILSFYFGEPSLDTFVVAGNMRWLVTWHTTALFNSWAHGYGDQPYIDEGTVAAGDCSLW